jgi:hypothetical protein
MSNKKNGDGEAKRIAMVTERERRLSKIRDEVRSKLSIVELSGDQRRLIEDYYLNLVSHKTKNGEGKEIEYFDTLSAEKVALKNEWCTDYFWRLHDDAIKKLMKEVRDFRVLGD